MSAKQENVVDCGGAGVGQELPVILRLHRHKTWVGLTVDRLATLGLLHAGINVGQCWVRALVEWTCFKMLCWAGADPPLATRASSTVCLSDTSSLRTAQVIQNRNYEVRDKAANNLDDAYCRTTIGHRHSLVVGQCASRRYSVNHVLSNVGNGRRITGNADSGANASLWQCSWVGCWVVTAIPLG